MHDGLLVPGACTDTFITSVTTWRLSCYWDGDPGTDERFSSTVNVTVYLNPGHCLIEWDIEVGQRPHVVCIIDWKLKYWQEMWGLCNCWHSALPLIFFTDQSSPNPRFRVQRLLRRTTCLSKAFKETCCSWNFSQIQLINLLEQPLFMPKSVWTIHFKWLRWQCLGNMGKLYSAEGPSGISRFS